MIVTRATTLWLEQSTCFSSVYLQLRSWLLLDASKCYTFTYVVQWLLTARSWLQDSLGTFLSGCLMQSAKYTVHKFPDFFVCIKLDSLKIPGLEFLALD